MNALEGNVAIVSGASAPHGIGRTTAHCLALPLAGGLPVGL